MVSTEPTSPRKVTVGGLENYAPNPGKSNSSRPVIKGEVIERIIFDDEQVLRRLRVNDIGSGFVDRCFNTFFTSNATAIKALQDLEALATGAPITEETKDDKKNRSKDEAKSKNDNENNKNKNKKHEKKNEQDPTTSTDHVGDAAVKKKKQETLMYPHLRTLFEYIESMDDAATSANDPRRAFRPNGAPLTSEESPMAEFPSVIPDFTLQQSATVQSQKWRQLDGFGEIKATKVQGPKPAQHNVVKEIVAQSVDYARLHMSARPFLLFSVGLLIFGSDFCVGIFDRDGVTFSPIMNLWADTKDFIRVVRSLTRVLTAVELGHDPSVTMLSSRISAKINPDGYPSFRVASIGSDPREWCTLGPPMWSSLSLFGRGTAVWSVLEYKDGAPPDPNTQKVMKTAWRNPLRHSEAEIYRTIKGQPPAGLAEFLTGADVTTPNGDTVCIAYLRGKSSKASGSAILHRIILNTVGRPVWTYTSDLELLKGMEAAGKAHKFLSDQQIIHGDISPGNILLAKDSMNAPMVGFLADLELAQLPSDLPMERSTDKSSEGGVLPGTLLFAATERLEAFRDGKHVAHTADHDVESFVLAMEYIVMRKLLVSAKDDQERRDLTKALRHAFGHTSLENIITSRSGPAAYWLSLPLIGDIISREISEPLRKLLAFLGYRVIDRNAARVREQCEDFTHFFEDQKPKRLADIPLNHSVLFSALSVAIGMLEGKVGRG